MHRFPRSTVWDPLTQQTVDGLRAFMHREPQPTISHIQRESVKPRPLKGPFQATRNVLQAPPEDDVRQLLFEAIAKLGDTEYESPTLAHVPVEWIVESAFATQPESQVSSGLTVLHVHGGAFFQGSPSAYRPTTTRLAKSSGGRVVSIRYRLAPQHPLPAAQLDILMTYLSLLYPPSGSNAIPLHASQIVFAGDSCGGSLLYNILQIIQETARHPPIKFHSHTIHFPLPKPAGIATLSLAGELLGSYPSETNNIIHDILLDVPWSGPGYPACNLWPSTPPRPMLHAYTESHSHPMFTISLQHSWADAPPMWFAVGEEQLVDSSRAVARRAARDGVNVSWLQFEAMPHCFATLPGLNRSQQAALCFDRWGTFCRECVEINRKPERSVKAVEIGFKNADERPIQLDSEAEEKKLPLADLERRVRHRMEKVEKTFSRAWSKL